MGKTIILTSHDTGDIADLCQRVLIINNGRLALDNSIEEFGKLNDTRILKIKLSKSLDIQTTQNWLNKMDLQVNKLQPEILEVQVPEKKSTETLKLFLEKFEVADIEIASEPIEDILREIYNNEYVD